MKLATMRKISETVSSSKGGMTRVHKLRIESTGAYFMKSGKVVKFLPPDVGTEVMLYSSVNKPLEQKMVFMGA